ncbi:MAG: YajQ family cyclic di-GMP-binding protein [Chloroflexota bacterium]|nr:YajQ family cyclic di-GMP-binding protein [Chloroflexota bacterium]
MPTEYSFDVVSEYDRQELANAIDQTTRELTTRYDLKNTGSSIELDKESLTLASANEMSLNAIRDILLERAVRRKVSPKVFDFGKVEEASRGTVRQTVTLKKGVSQELAREITKLIRDRLPKLKTQVQGDAVRVTGRNKDELQDAMQALRSAETERKWTLPLQFNNYR